MPHVSSTVRGCFIGLLLLGALSLPTRAWAQAMDPTPEQAFADAYTLYATQVYAQAAHAFATFRTDHPQHPSAAEALYYQADATLALGDSDAAVRLFRQFQREFPVHPLAFEARLALGKYFYETQQPQQAIATLNEVLANDPPYDLAAKALYWMGESALLLDQTDEALRYFTRAANDYRYAPTADVAQYAIDFTEVRLGRYNDAARSFEVLASRYPDSPYARNIGLALAEVYYELADYRRAVEEINRRMPTLGTDGRERATFLLAESYNQLRITDDAIIQYRRFTEGNPNSPYYRRALYGLAWNYYYAEAHQLAAVEFAKVYPNETDELAHKAMYYEGVNRKITGELQTALGLFQGAVQGWPEGVLADEAQFEAGVTLYELRRWREANEAFTQLVRTYRTSPFVGEALRLQGDTYIAIGDFDAAFESFDRAINLDAAPQELRDEVTFQKAWLLYRNQDFVAAAPEFQNLHRASPNARKAADALFWAAESYYQLDKLDLAERLFTEYLRTYTDGAQRTAAHYALGWVAFRESRYDTAIRQFTRFLDTYNERNEYVPYRTDAQLRIADSHYALKQYPRAIRMYQRVGNQGGDYALYQTGQAYYNAGDAVAAITTFRTLFEEFPGSEWRQEAQYQLGYIYFQNQDFDQAVETYEDLIRRYPQDGLAAKAQYGIGDALYNAGQYDASVTAYQRVLNRFPRSPFVADAITGMQNALIILDDEARTTAIIDSFATANPDSPIVDQLRFRQAEVQYQTGQLDAALASLQQFIRSSGDASLLPEAYFYMGSIFEERDQKQEATSYFRQLLRSYQGSPRAPEAARRVGAMSLDSGDARRALEAYQQMETLAGEDGLLIAQARYGQGLALMQQGRNDEAERLLQDAIDRAPDAPETAPAVLGLARIKERQGEATEAARLYRTIAQNNRNDEGAEALYRLGDLLLRSGNPSGAVETWSRMATLFGSFYEWNAQSYLGQARAFVQMGRSGEAKRIYEKVENEFSGTPYADTATQEKANL
ncbi:MAG: tetratricopeptide repeat protein [Bacteroidota bacterium]